jgi:hypothetical protein
MTPAGLMQQAPEDIVAQHLESGSLSEQIVAQQ